MAVVGRIARPHGIRGQVIVNPETDFPARAVSAGRRAVRETCGSGRARTSETVSTSRRPSAFHQRAAGHRIRGRRRHERGGGAGRDANCACRSIGWRRCRRERSTGTTWSAARWTRRTARTSGRSPTWRARSAAAGSWSSTATGRGADSAGGGDLPVDRSGARSGSSSSRRKGCSN